MSTEGGTGALEARAGRLAEYAQRSLEQFDAEAARARLEEQIRARPLTSVALALAAGFLVGRLLRS